MRIAVLSAGGGLGRNVVDAARAAKPDVVALVRDPKRAELADDVTPITGDATRGDDLMRAMTGADATMFCVMPPLSTWLLTFQPLLECAARALVEIATAADCDAAVSIYRERGRRRASSCTGRAVERPMLRVPRWVAVRGLARAFDG